MMYGINRILKRHGFPDIHKSDSFLSSRHAFEAAKRELVKEGKGATQSAPEINEEGSKNSIISVPLKIMVKMQKFFVHQHH